MGASLITIFLVLDFFSFGCTQGTGSAPSPAACRAPTISGGRLNCEHQTIVEGTRCVVICDAGFTHSNPSQTIFTCTNGQFANVPTCTGGSSSAASGSPAVAAPSGQTCTAPRIANGRVNCERQTLTEGTRCIVNCTAGFTHSNPAQPIFTCSGGQFTNVPTCAGGSTSGSATASGPTGQTCSTPRIANGRLNCESQTLTEGTRCMVNCNTGFTHSNPTQTVFTCTNGQFTNTPTCTQSGGSTSGSPAVARPTGQTGQTCTQPRIANGRLNCESQTLTEGSRCMVNCNNGFTHSNPTQPIFTCTNGQFTNVPTCNGGSTSGSPAVSRPTGATCTQPRIANGRLNCESQTLTEGTRCMVNCNTGFTHSNPTQPIFTCTNGQFTNVPTCNGGSSSGTVPMAAPPGAGSSCTSPVIPNGRLNCESQTLSEGTRCMVNCHPGFTHSNPMQPVFTCQGGQFVNVPSCYAAPGQNLPPGQSPPQQPGPLPTNGCRQPPAPSNGIMVCQGDGSVVPDRGTCLISCDAGFAFGEPEMGGILTCNARNGQFLNVPGCVRSMVNGVNNTCQMPVLANGTVNCEGDGTAVPDLGRCAFTCDAGFVLSDAETSNMTCEVGEGGFEVIPTCGPPPPPCWIPSVLHGIALCQSDPVPDMGRCEIRCDEGFTHPHHSARFIRCRGGVFMGPPPACYNQSSVPGAAPGNPYQPGPGNPSGPRCQMPSVVNGRVNCERFPLMDGVRCMVTCNPGATLSTPGQQIFTCRGGQFANIPTCDGGSSGVTCNMPQIANGQVRCERQPLTEGVRCMVNCNSGFVHSNPSQPMFTCRGGQFTDIPTCNGRDAFPVSGPSPHTCTMPNVANGRVNCERQPLTEGVRCMLNCNSGFTHSNPSQPMFTCRAGQFGAIPTCSGTQILPGQPRPLPQTPQPTGQCDPPTVQHGNVFCATTPVMSGGSCRYHCTAGYEPTGPSITCTNGQFQAPLPSCTPTSVPRIPGCPLADAHVQFAQVTCANNNQDPVLMRESCAVRCHDGYELRGSGTVTCSGRFGFTDLPTCVRPAGCVRPTVHNGQVQCRSTSQLVPVQSVCGVTCNPGYALSNPSASTVTCNADNTFGTLPSCNGMQQPAACSVPRVPHGRVTCPGRAQRIPHGMFCYVTCERGYAINDDAFSRLTCDASGHVTATPACIDQCPDGSYHYAGYYYSGCLRCRPGAYRTQGAGHGQCQPCPCGQTTNDYGSTSQLDCITPPRFNTGQPGLNTGQPGLNTGQSGLNTGQPGLNTGGYGQYGNRRNPNQGPNCRGRGNDGEQGEEEEEEEEEQEEAGRASGRRYY